MPSPRSTATRSRITVWCCTCDRRKRSNPSIQLAFCGSQHLPRVRERLARDLHAAEHACDFVAATGAVQCLDGDACLSAIAGFDDAQVRMTLRGDLRQVRYAQHLALAAESAQFSSDDFG